MFVCLFLVLFLEKLNGLVLYKKIISIEQFLPPGGSKRLTRLTVLSR